MRRSFVLLPIVLFACGSRPPQVDVLPATDTADTIGPYVVTATIADDGDIVRAELFWSNGAPGAAVPATFVKDAAGTRWEASIPGQAAGTTVRYSVEVEDDEGHVIVLPVRALPGEPPSAFEFRVGP